MNATQTRTETNSSAKGTETATRSTTMTVISKDGTRIAYDRLGDGPPVILISGATADRHGNGPLAEALADDFAVFNYDRRGRGGSSDTLPFALEREFEDIAALIKEAGGTAHLYGISSGGALALEAAAAGLPVASIAVYEVPYDLDPVQPQVQKEYKQALEDAMRSGISGAAAEVFLHKVGASDDDIAHMRGTPMWDHLVSTERTLICDATAMGDGQPPADRLAKIKAPVCVITGGGEHEVGSAEFFATAAKEMVKHIPTAEHKVIPGQPHDVDPQALVRVLKAFYKRV